MLTIRNAKNMIFHNVKLSNILGVEINKDETVELITEDERECG
jgi:hypothetical protein